MATGNYLEGAYAARIDGVAKQASDKSDIEEFDAFSFFILGVCLHAR